MFKMFHTVVHQFNAYCHGTVDTDDDSGNPVSVWLHAGGNSTGILSGEVRVSISGKTHEGFPYHDPIVEPFGPGHEASAGVTNTDDEPVPVPLRATSDANAFAYVDGLKANGERVGRKYDLDWNSHINAFECTQFRRNPDPAVDEWIEMDCVPPES